MVTTNEPLKDSCTKCDAICTTGSPTVGTCGHQRETVWCFFFFFLVHTNRPVLPHLAFLFYKGKQARSGHFKHSLYSPSPWWPLHVSCSPGLNSPELERKEDLRLGTKCSSSPHIRYVLALCKSSYWFLLANHVHVLGLKGLERGWERWPSVKSTC